MTAKLPGIAVLATVSALLATSLALGCGRETAAAGAPAGAPAGAKPVEVVVVTVTPSAVTLTRELPGRTSAFRVAEVRARVNGIVQKRLFTEGSDVKEGQPLFEIDPTPYQASLASARATLTRAEATLKRARLLSGRNKELLSARAVSQEAYDEAEAALHTAEADVAAGRAAVQQAKINLDYTRVVAPIAGRIGRSGVTEGAYVQQSAATLMATIQQIDPVYVDVTQATAEVLKLRRDLERGALKAEDGSTSVTLLLEDGQAYAEKGTLQFADISVDEGTGSIVLRAIFPNPRRELLPGMFVRARLEEGVNAQALLVPQRAVTRDQKGQATALVVGAESKVERRTLVTDRVIGDAWLVTEGLAAGEQVIVEGLQKVRPGAVVVAVEAAPKAER